MVVIYPLDICICIITIMAVSGLIAVGISVTLHYIKSKHHSVLFFGLAFITISIPWVVHILNYVFYILTGSVLPSQSYFLIGYTFIMITVSLWIIGIVTVSIEKALKPILFLLIPLNIFYIISFLLLIFTNIGLIGTNINFWKADYGPFLMITLISVLSSQLISTIVFIWDAIGIKDPEAQLKAKFFGLMEICFVFGVILDIMPFFITEFTFLAKTFIVLAAFFLYIAILMPEWIKKRFIKNK